jgi:DNA-binding NtrC family response regulator
MDEFNNPPEGKPETDSRQSQPSFHQHILVVEEEGDLRQLNAEVLADAGYQVEVAEDGAAAWAALQLHNYDLLITSQFLPKVSGVELLKKLHTARMTLPVIMATSILPTWEFALHPCLQAVKMLRKPYTIDKLVSMVKSVLPHTADFRAEIALASGQAGQFSADRLRRG